jgi:hypothetical protein
MAGYAYAYPSPAVLSGTYLQMLRHLKRVADGGGIVQDESYVYEYYATADRTGLTNAALMRRHYHALAGVKLNNVAGIDYVQEMYDLNPFTQINAVQANAANQPLWDTDSDVSYRVPRYNGTSHFMTIDDLPIYNAQPAGTIQSVCKDTNRTGGSAIHYIMGINGNADFSRASLVTRRAGDTAGIISRRLDDGTTTIVSPAGNYAGFRTIDGLYIWGGNSLNLVVDGSSVASGAITNGGGITSATNSLSVIIGSFNNGAANTFFPGVISSVHAWRAALSLDQLATFRQLEKRFNSALP